MLDLMLWIEKKTWKTLEQQGNGDLRLGAGKRRPQTEMRTTAKGEKGRNAEMRDEVRDGLRNRALLEAPRWSAHRDRQDWGRNIFATYPGVSTTKDAAETGIIAQIGGDTFSMPSCRTDGRSANSA